ncbi:(2Fe-2S)-binding protein [Alkalihalobacillus sp. TS-13]|uniref:(2Fe-2S)-binding protein n=1 Tax=Alkalihalobacillus sp. TS-13 TaxID=2842455 RepID=UPI001C87A2AF|nr:(2Fe-2S)-binding protein [Alkalihalobacillus sp. TS-13]
MRENQTLVCRCEEVTLEELLRTINTFQCSARELKLRTRAGMGVCGGRTCRSSLDLLISQREGENSSDSIPLKYQPPIRPITFKNLGDI